MDLWGKIVLAIDVAALLYLLRSMFLLFKVVRSAGDKIMHVFPSRNMLIGTMLINFFGMFATTYSYFTTFNVVYLMFLAIFLLNAFTMFSRIVGIYENGVVIYGKLMPYKGMKKTVWGAEKKKHFELEIRMKDQDAVPLYINVPKDKKEQVAKVLKQRAGRY